MASSCPTAVIFDDDGRRGIHGRSQGEGRRTVRICIAIGIRIIEIRVVVAASVAQDSKEEDAEQNQEDGAHIGFASIEQCEGADGCYEGDHKHEENAHITSILCGDGRRRERQNAQAPVVVRAAVVSMGVPVPFVVMV
jgi:hypothetical protein